MKKFFFEFWSFYDFFLFWKSALPFSKNFGTVKSFMILPDLDFTLIFKLKILHEGSEMVTSEFWHSTGSSTSYVVYSNDFKSSEEHRLKKLSGV